MKVTQPRRPRPLNRAAVAGAALTYGLLLSYCAALYVLVLAVGGVRYGHPGPAWLYVVATVAVVATVEPARRWLRTNVEEVVHGHHENAYAAIISLQRELDVEPSSGLSPLPAIIARSVNLPYVVIELSGEPPQVYGEPAPGAATTQLPILFRTEHLGTVAAGHRRRGLPLSAADLVLLRDLTGQVAVSVFAQRAAVQVQESRAELVTAREEERRRIRRDLHDGLGPTLAAMQLQLKAVQRLLPDNPGAASDIVVDLLADARTTAADVRRLVYDLRPPRLDELGLVGALRNQWTVPTAPALVIDVDPGLPELPAAVEVAIYRIATEALQNVVKHAGATKACVVLEGDGERVRLSVSDDGRGLPEPLIAGVGLTAMRERAEELGGTVDVARQGDWTTVVVELPMRAAGG